VLMNALYFKDSWVHSFSASDSQEGDFHTADGKTVTKTFMSQTEEFSYYADSETQLVLLPMNGGVTAAFVLGSTEHLDEKIASATERSVTVRLPKLDLETSLSSGELVGFLQSRGVNAAFDENRADFSAMIDHDIYVSDILQKTRVKTDEDGIEAAAVTAVMMRDSCIVDPSEPVTFNADRPFSFRLYTTCNEKTAVLFAGRITE